MTRPRTATKPRPTLYQRAQRLKRALRSWLASTIHVANEGRYLCSDARPGPHAPGHGSYRYQPADVLDVLGDEDLETLAQAFEGALAEGAALPEPRNVTPPKPTHDAPRRLVAPPGSPDAPERAT